MNIYQKLVIAAYLHDIGKLAIRGGNYRNQKNFEVAHAQFVNDFLDKLNNKDWADIGTIAAHHHGKDVNAVLNGDFDEDIKFATWCVYMADNLSAKERLEANEKEDFSHISFPLGNIFDVLRFGDVVETNKKQGWEPVKLSDFEATSIDYNQTEKYKNLFNDFEKDLENLIKSNLQIENFNKFISQLDTLLQNYLTLVPSDTYNTKIADISLYDHSKLVVAFSIFLFKAFKNFENKKELYKLSTDKVLDKLNQLDKKVLLVGGDFPGIQKYIFKGIKKSSKITKRLRARSFMVQLLSEAVIEYILDKFDLPRANVLINAGGKFVILAGVDSEENKKLIRQINYDVNKFLLEKYPGLKFSILGKGYNLKEIIGSGEDIYHVFLDLFENLSKQKFRLYDNQLLKKVFSKEEVSGKVLCKYCGMKYIDKKFDKEGRITETNDDICENCEKEIGLGEKLVKEIGKNGIFINYKDKNGDFIFELGLKYNKNENENKKDKKFELINKGQLLIQINDWNLNLNKNFEKVIGKSINLYVPKNDNDILLSFEDILKKYSKENGYLVMVKGDVDNMSLILKHGFEKHYSLSRLLTLSRFLELFFGKILNHFLENKFNQVYTIFSGGDDFVFIVPLVDNSDNKNLVVIDFLKGLYSNFSKFTNNNPYIHFSISLTLFKKDTPISIVYELGEKYLKQAKSLAKKDMLNVENDDDAKKELKKYIIAGIDDGHFVLVDLNDNFEEKLLNIHIDRLKTFDLIPNLQDKSSLRYKIYQIFKDLLKFIEKGEYSNYINLSSKLLYLLRRNDFKRKDLKNLENFIGKIDLSNDGKYKKKIMYAENLFKLALQIYKDR